MNKVINVSLLKTALTAFLTALHGIFPQRKVVNVTIPLSQTTVDYEDSWITAGTDCYWHNMENVGIDRTVTWEFTNGKVSFTISSALTASSKTFSFGMIKGGV